MGLLNPSFQVTLEQFQALRDERPKEEKWELIGGTPVMMPPPTLMHQRIARNLEHLLSDKLAQAKPEWIADREIGVLLVDDDRFCPEPDVIVIETEFIPGQIHTQHFYFVAEVLSENDRPRVLALKREFYMAHEACRAMMFIRQDRIEAELAVREGGKWRSNVLTQTEAALVIPDIGPIGLLRDLYRHTPLWQAQWSR